MLSQKDKEYAHDVIAGDIEYCQEEGFPCEWCDETASDMSRGTLESSGFSKEEIKEAFDSFEG